MLQVVDEGKNRAIQVEKEGFPDAVVWNPWIKKAASMADFGDEEYKVGQYPASTPLSIEQYQTLGDARQCLVSPSLRCQATCLPVAVQGLCLLSCLCLLSS